MASTVHRLRTLNAGWPAIDVVVTAHPPCPAAFAHDAVPGAAAAARKLAKAAKWTHGDRGRSNTRRHRATAAFAAARPRAHPGSTSRRHGDHGEHAVPPRNRQAPPDARPAHPARTDIPRAPGPAG